MERKLCAYYRKDHALAVSNATTGLFAVALALDLGRGEVITTPLTWGGTIAGLLQLDARLNFADVDATTLALDPVSAERLLTPETRAICAVDLFGVPADDTALRALADRHGIWYIHDAAQSFGARIDDRPAGAASHVLVVSFSSGKPIDAGEGGAILTDDTDIYQRLIWLTQHPERQRRDLGFGLVNEFALNLRIHPAAAEVALSGFDDALLAVKARRTAYTPVLQAMVSSGFVDPVWSSGQRLEPSYYKLAVPVDRRASSRRRLARHLATAYDAELIDLGLVPLYQHAAFDTQLTRRCQPACPTAEWQSGRRMEVRLRSVAHQFTRQTSGDRTARSPAGAGAARNGRWVRWLNAR